MNRDYKAGAGQNHAHRVDFESATWWMKVGEKDQPPSTIVQSPLAFVRSGYFDLNTNKMYSVGSYNFNQSRTSRSATEAYFLYMSPTNINLSGNNYRWLAFPLRYLSPASFHLSTLRKQSTIFTPLHFSPNRV